MCLGVILTEVGAAGLMLFTIFLQNIVLALTRPKKCIIFRNSDSFLSYSLNKIVFTNNIDDDNYEAPAYGGKRARTKRKWGEKKL